LKENFMFESSRIPLLIALLAGGCAPVHESDVAIAVPPALEPAASESLALVVPASGVQIYECRASAAAAGRHEWAFVAPEAILFDLRGKSIGRHYAGPHWEAVDGSKIVARLKARTDAPEGNAIPWLLLEARSVGTKGAFSNVSSIQRVKTVGGLAPSGGCTEATIGTPARVQYTAHYYFFSQR
jgi:hypothetical protein